MKGHTRNKGFTLIEVLVTLVLLTIGMLALVSMQGRGIQFTADSVARNNAIMLASEMMEVMRANPAARDTYLFVELPAEGTCPEDNEDVEASNVAEQITCWSKKVRTLLPGTNGNSAKAEAVRNNFYICRSKELGTCDASGGSAIDIQVAWRSVGERCRDGEGEGDEDPFICTLRLRGEL
ncbi:type IV pilus modification protein PilV [Stutzerimonas zhaodongensis]|uniref:type IV pilus modification protein PilV n=1 Tax=Stutzerimonas zhaodongensis TaxID=1176257 RepID=UPI0039EFA1B2